MLTSRFVSIISATAIIIFALFVMPVSVVLVVAQPPSPLLGPKVSSYSSNLSNQTPAPPQSSVRPYMPQPEVLDPTAIYNDLIVPSLPTPSVAAGVLATDGPNILPKVTKLAVGGNLSYPNVPKPTPCVGFNNINKWASHILTDGKQQGSVGTDHYAGWGTFAVDDGGYYRSNNVAFSYDASIGNGISAKISSNQPYGAGLASPLIRVKPGDTIIVRVRYLLANIGTNKVAYDWASLGVKPNAKAKDTRYVNGFVHGEWAEMENMVHAQSDRIMVLLQANSPAALNSNVYFDDVEIRLNGVALTNCEFANTPGNE